MALPFKSIHKALAPAILALGTVVAQWVDSGKFDAAEARTIAAGAVLSVVVFFVPNAPKA